jgi:hypothetical protein
MTIVGFMKTNRIVLPMISILATLFLIGVAYFLELWLQAAKASFSINFNTTVYFLQSIIIHVILATCLIAFNWLVNSKASPNRIVSWIIFIVGVLLTIYPILFSVFVKYTCVNTSLRGPMILDQLFPVTILSIACTFIGVIGFVSLFRKPS